MSFLQNELLSKNEIIKLLMGKQSSVLYTMPKNSSPSENCSLIQRQSLHHLQPHSGQRDIHVFNNLEINCTNNKIMKHKNMVNYTKIIEHSNTSSSKTNSVSCI